MIDVIPPKIKAALAAGALAAAFFAGAWSENRTWTIRTTTAQLSTEKGMKELREKAQAESDRSRAFSDFIEGYHNDKIDELQRTKADNSYLTNTVSRLRQQKLCQRSSPVRENNPAEIHQDNSTGDLPGFGNEMEAAIESDVKRDKELIEWINDTNKVIQDLCTKSNVTCN